ncbi:MAG: PQQ-binding-like beta-propeller repeat protein [Phycisphaerae bacterium]|nr:PQQ-binding-like beta-propeller repeat protein [Phycisphaerae bacterium]
MVQPDCVGVVPVFVNVGFAVVPAIAAALSSALAVLFNPKELMRVFKEKPYIPVIVVAVLIGVILLVTFLTGDGDARHDAAAAVQASDPDNQPIWATLARSVYETRQQDLRGRWIKQRRINKKYEAELESLRDKIARLQEGADPATRPATASAANGGDGSGDGDSHGDAAGEAFYFRGGPRRTGYGGGDSARNLMRLWTESERARMYLSSPAVVGEDVYGASCYMALGRNYGSVFRLNAVTGRELWEVESGEDPNTGEEVEFKGFFSSPAVTADGEYLVIGQGLHADVNSELICLNTSDGSLHWAIPTPLHIEGSPAIAGDIVVAGAGAVEVGEEHKPSGHPGFVLCVRISDGKVLWRHDVNDPESSPAIADGVCYIGSGFNGKAVYALRTASDEELQASGEQRVLWKADTPYPATGPVTLTDDLALIGCGKGDFVFRAAEPVGLVLALDRKTGDEQWRVDLPDAVLGAIAVRDGVAYVPVRTGAIMAIDLATREVLWSGRVDGETPVMSAPAVTDKYVYATSTNGYMAVFDITSGERVEKVYINHEAKPGEQALTVSSPFVQDGMLFVGSETGGLRCYVGEESD